MRCAGHSRVLIAPLAATGQAPSADNAFIYLICLKKSHKINTYRGIKMKKILIIIGIVFLLSACETPETFKVIYHADEYTTGFPPTDDNQYKSGDYATVLGQNTLLKQGYKFSGWNTKADFSGDKYTSGSKIKIKNINIFLYAVWDEMSIMIGIE